MIMVWRESATLIGRYTARMTRFRGITHTIAGTADDLPRVSALLAGAGIDPVGNPDVYVRAYASFGIDEARELIRHASGKALAAPHRVFVIASPSLTIEAQNALLKTFEEAPNGATFFIVTPLPDLLLPTVRSRSIPLTLPGSAARSGSIDAPAFLKAAPAERIDMLKALLETDERDIAGAFALLGDIERSLAPRVAEPAVREGLYAVYRAREYLGDKGSLLKSLLEQVALLVPVI